MCKILPSFASITIRKPIQAKIFRVSRHAITSGMMIRLCKQTFRKGNRMKHLIIAATIVIIGASVAFAFTVNQYAGTWLNADANTRGITRIEIRVHDSKADVRVWGKCSPQDCDWGWTPANSYADSHLTANYRSSNIVRDLTLTMTNRMTLKVRVRTQYTDNSGRPTRGATYTFRRILTPTGQPLKPVRRRKTR
jgi:hypothetical protein